jgi:hypothetical protein
MASAAASSETEGSLAVPLMSSVQLSSLMQLPGSEGTVDLWLMGVVVVVAVGWWW